MDNTFNLMNKMAFIRAEKGNNLINGSGEKFALQGEAPDGPWVHKFHTKEQLIEDAKGYPGEKTGKNSWVTDYGVTVWTDDVTYDEIFGKEKI